MKKANYDANNDRQHLITKSKKLSTYFIIFK